MTGRTEDTSARVRAYILGLLAALLVLPATGRADSTVLSGVPDYDWFYGCSPTAAGMLIGYYDRNGYDDKSYGSLVPGGNAELNTYSEDYSEDWSAKAHSAIASEEHVDDYWGNPDPMGSDRTSTAEWNCLADFMGTSQGSKSNGVTMWHTASTTAHDYTDCAQDYGLNGIVDYIQYAGYDVSTAYRQADTTGTVGFTFDDFKAEIDAGRPVLVHVTGHTMLGYGYCENAGNEIITVYDTWNEGGGTMTWGGSYSGKSHVACTAITLTGGHDQIDAEPGSSPGWVGVDDGATVTAGWHIAYAEWGDNETPSQ